VLAGVGDAVPFDHAEVDGVGEQVGYGADGQGFLRVVTPPTPAQTPLGEFVGELGDAVGAGGVQLERGADEVGTVRVGAMKATRRPPIDARLLR